MLCCALVLCCAFPQLYSLLCGSQLNSAASGEIGDAYLSKRRKFGTDDYDSEYTELLFIEGLL